MTNRELEQKIQTATEHAAPDKLETILSQCGQQESVTTAEHSTASGLQTSAQDIMEKLSRPFRTSSCIIFDVNPSVCLETDEGEHVLASEALNEDGIELLAPLDLTGLPLETAVDALVEAMMQNGYLNEMQNSILVSVENYDADKQEHLREKVSDIVEDVVNESLNGTGESASVLSQTVDEADEDLADLAGTYDVSLGKAALIRKVVEDDGAVSEDAEDTPLTFGDLASMPVNDIALIAEERPVADNSVTCVGRASERSYIGHAAALQTAMAYAGLNPDQVGKYKVKLDSNKGLMVYEVKLKTIAGTVKYSLDARTGDMVYRKKDIKTAPYTAADERRNDMSNKIKYYGYGDNNMNNNVNDNMTGNMTGNMNDNVNNGTNADYSNIPVPEGAIGEEAAKAAALAHAGISESDTLYIYCHPEVDHGRMEHYDVKFVAGGMKYKYAIGIMDGKVLGRGVKDKRNKGNYVYEGNYHEHYAPMPSNDAGTSTPAGSAAPSAPNEGTPQPAAPAQQNAAPNAAPAQQNAAPTAAPAPGNFIGEDKALSIALERSGLTLSNLEKWKVKLVNKHGRTIYRTKLKIRGFEYECDVDAFNGTVTKFHKEIDY